MRSTATDDGRIGLEPATPQPVAQARARDTVLMSIVLAEGATQDRTRTEHVEEIPAHAHGGKRSASLVTSVVCHERTATARRSGSGRGSPANVPNPTVPHPDGRRRSPRPAAGIAYGNGLRRTALTDA